MTNEQIKQNAEAYADKLYEDGRCTESTAPTIQEIYITGAHSRDEEIKKLEKKLSALETVIVTARAAISMQEAIVKDLRNPWRNVNKELPKEYENVIVMTDTNTPTCGYVENGKFILDADCITGKVMCWMPIPELKGGEK